MHVDAPTLIPRSGTITRRQTTFWEFDSEAGTHRWRIQFLRKHEFYFETPQFEFLQILDSHPLLAEYQEAEASLLISQKCAEADRLLRDLDALATSHFAGWRSLARYLNPSVPADKLLREGFGLLLRGPRLFVGDAHRLVSDAGVACQFEPGVERPRVARALILGKNFVVAGQFRFEQVA